MKLEQNPAYRVAEKKARYATLILSDIRDQIEGIQNVFNCVISLSREKKIDIGIIDAIENVKETYDELLKKTDWELSNYE